MCKKPFGCLSVNASGVAVVPIGNLGDSTGTLYQVLLSPDVLPLPYPPTSVVTLVPVEVSVLCINTSSHNSNNNQHYFSCITTIACTYVRTCLHIHFFYSVFMNFVIVYEIILFSFFFCVQCLLASLPVFSNVMFLSLLH